MLIKDGTEVQTEKRRRGRPPKRLTQAEAAVTPPDLSDLPPPGAARDDALRARADQLQEAMETMTPEKEALDPSRYKPIREVQAMLQESIKEHGDAPISGALPDYEYCLVRYREPGSQVEIKRTQSVYDTRAGATVAVWEVVQGDMPEMMERRDVHGWRVIADTLLMRARKDRLAAWRDHERYQANRFSQRAQGDFLDQARRTKGIRVVESQIKDEGGIAITQSQMRDALAKQLGAKLVTDKLKAGAPLTTEVGR